MVSKKTMPGIMVLASYSIFAIIVSTILTNTIQIYTMSLIDILQAYLYVYLFSFMPLFIVMLIVVLQPKVKSRLIVILCLLAFIVTFVIVTSVSMYSVDTTYTSLIARFINIFKFLPVFVLESNNFGSFVLIVNIVEMLIFLAFALAYKKYK